MRVVWKFPIRSSGEEIKIPAGAEIIHVGFVSGHPTLWALVDPSEGWKVSRRFHVYGTGHPIPAGMVYVGTCIERLIDPPPLVWHIFE